MSRLRKLLQSHPDKELSSYICTGLTRGFDIGFTGPRRTIVAKNLSSAAENSKYITDYLHACCERRETAGPFQVPPFPVYQCSGIGSVPKKNGKLRIIHHLSAPEGTSVNDFISRDDFSLSYITIDDAVKAIMEYGVGALLTKLDIRNAFRLIPVRPEDRPLLGICWEGLYYFESVLPFGLRSSPYIFDRVASAIEWAIKTNCSIKHLMHYLDDYLHVSPPSHSLATKYKNIIVSAFEYLSVPLASEKLEGPVTSLTFLGITLDTVRMEARLPPEKLTELRLLTEELATAEVTTKRKFEHFLGKLSFASSVIIPGRTFTRRLWDLNRRFGDAKPFYRITLSSEALKDIKWWQHLLSDWNGKSFLLYNDYTLSTDLGLCTDASGTIGWGAFFGDELRWIQGKWEPDQADKSITYKELYALATACATWGSNWARMRILIHCDNQAVVDCIKSGTSHSPAVMTLLRALFLVCAKGGFTISAVHVPGKVNTVADSLSRFNMQVFRRLVPAAKETPDTALPLPFEAV